MGEPRAQSGRIEKKRYGVDRLYTHTLFDQARQTRYFLTCRYTLSANSDWLVHRFTPMRYLSRMHLAPGASELTVPRWCLALAERTHDIRFKFDKNKFLDSAFVKIEAKNDL